MFKSLFHNHWPEWVALLTVTIWGTNFAFQKALLAEITPWAYLWARFAGMLVIGWVIVARTGRQNGAPVRIARSDLPRFVLSGLVGYCFYIGLSTVGLAYTTAFSSALLVAMSPLFTALMLGALRLEKVNGGQYLGMGIAVAGMGIFVAEKIQIGATQAGIGDLISVLSVLGWSAYNVLNKPLLAKYPAPFITTVCLSFGAAPIFVLALPEMLAQNWNGISGGAWLALAWSIIAPVWLAWTLWSWVNARRGVAKTSVFMYLVPLVGGVASWALLGESFTPLKLAGAALALAGMGVARRMAGGGRRTADRGSQTAVTHTEPAPAGAR
jgi:drug/metabolite transporter (DMT)-like permease